MDSNCSNCNQAIIGNFCSNCGQKKYKRINKNYIWEEVQYTLLHTNKGFLYSIKKIIKNPGKTAKEFIEGKRVNHYKPLLLVFVLSGISAFISFKVIGMEDTLKDHFSANEDINTNFLNNYITFLSSYSSILMLSLLPGFAFLTWLVLRKWGHNYYEHIVMNSYILSFYTLFGLLVIYPVMFFLKKDYATLMLATNLQILTVPFLLIWFFKTFYPEKSLIKIILNVLAVLVLLIFGFVLIVIIGFVIGYIFGSLEQTPQ